MSNEELAGLIQQGIDIKANKTALYEQIRNYIYKIALKYKDYRDFEDLLQEGYIGLERAIGGFDPDKGFKFITYAGYWIEQSIKRYIDNTGNTARLPVHAIERINRYNRVVDSLTRENGEPPTVAEIARKMDLSTKQVETIRCNLQKQIQGSLNVGLYDDGREEAIDLVPSKDSVEDEVLEGVYQEELKNTLWGCVDELPEEQSTILHKHYQDNLYYEDIGALMGLSKDETYRLRIKAINNLRCGSSLKRLKPFADDIRSNAVQGTGVGAYNRSWTSATERVVLQRERYRKLMGDVMTEMEWLLRTENVPRDQRDEF